MDGPRAIEVVRESRLVIGMDYDLPSLNKHKAIERLVVGDISRLPFPNETFDLVSANMVVEHLEDSAVSLAEIRRILKPGGVFVFHTPNYLSPWVFFGSLAPDFVKLWLARLLEARAAADVFPTRYKMNTPAAVRNQAIRSGFDLEALRLVSTSAFFELLVIRLLRRPSLSRFRTNLIGVLRRSTAATPA